MHPAIAGVATLDRERFDIRAEHVLWIGNLVQDGVSLTLADVGPPTHELIAVDCFDSVLVHTVGLLLEQVRVIFRVVHYPSIFILGRFDDDSEGWKELLDRDVI